MDMNDVWLKPTNDRYGFENQKRNPQDSAAPLKRVNAALGNILEIEHLLLRHHDANILGPVLLFLSRNNFAENSRWAASDRLRNVQDFHPLGPALTLGI
jgi:hypothetical protein